MKGEIFDPVLKELKWVDGTRTMMTSTGKLVPLLPAEYDYVGVQTFAYPDVAKSKAYLHRWQTEYVTVNGADYFWGRGSACVAWVGARPQEWSQTTVLETAPAGADFAVVLAKFTRTAVPTHGWVGGQPVNVHVDQNVTIPFVGSLLMETGDPGFARAASIYIDSLGRLVLHRQQSVSVPPGGWGSRETSSGTPGSNGYTEYGSDWYPMSQQCMPLFTGSGSPNKRHASDTRPDSIAVPSPLRTCDKGSSAACSITDTSDYGSTWQLNITVMYCNRTRIA